MIPRRLQPFVPFHRHVHGQVCTDCPAELLPFHVKVVPDMTCVTESSLPGHATLGAAWGGSHCPQWCHEEDISYVFNNMEVRICRSDDAYQRS